MVIDERASARHGFAALDSRYGFIRLRIIKHFNVLYFFITFSSSDTSYHFPLVSNHILDYRRCGLNFSSLFVLIFYVVHTISVLAAV